MKPKLRFVLNFFELIHDGVSIVVKQTNMLNPPIFRIHLALFSYVA